MYKELYINGYCHIKNNSFSLNGNKITSEDKESSFSKFVKLIYQEKELAYPKFFKMDNLCKLAFLAAEILLENHSIDTNLKKDMAIVLSNRAASLDTDRKHQNSISDKDSYYPSPAVFVYTLPNIAIGEISIRHQIKGENVFFVSNTFNDTLIHQYATSLFRNGKSSNILCGWVDFDHEDYNAFMYLLSENGSIEYSSEFIKKTYLEN